MALLRFRLAYIIVAVLRSTALRRVVEGLHARHRSQGDMEKQPPSDLGDPIVCSLTIERSTSSGSRPISSQTPAVRGLDKPFHIIAGTVSWCRLPPAPGYPSRVAVIRTVSKFMTNEPP